MFQLILALWKHLFAAAAPVPQPLPVQSVEQQRLATGQALIACIQQNYLARDQARRDLVELAARITPTYYQEALKSLSLGSWLSLPAGTLPLLVALVIDFEICRHPAEALPYQMHLLLTNEGRINADIASSQDWRFPSWAKQLELLPAMSESQWKTWSKTGNELYSDAIREKVTAQQGFARVANVVCDAELGQAMDAGWNINRWTTEQWGVFISEAVKRVGEPSVYRLLNQSSKWHFYLR